MSEWKRYKLGELLSIKHGWAFKSENYVKDGKTALVTLRNISEDSRFVFDVNKTTYYGGEYPEEYNLNEGDLIIPLTEQVVGLLGNSAFVPNFSDIKFVLNQRVGKVQEKYEKIDKIFLKYLLSTTTVRTQMEYRASGTKQRNISPKDIYDIEVYIPELVIQKYIGRILYNLDKKIQINNQINQELEAMAKTLYDYWFVQFDFPDQNGKPYKSSGGKMVYHPELKREIPEGWGVETLKDFESKIITGKTPSRANSDNFGGEIPFITIGDIRGNTFIYSTSETLTDLGASVQQNKYLPEGSLCVSCIATVGEIGFTTEWSHTNQQINSIVFEDKTHRYYLYFALKNYFENAKASAKTGNTFANMNKEDFSGIRIILPRNEIKNNFHKITEPYFAQIKCLQGQNQELTQLRDWLLPMLMNGQVKVE